MEIHSCSDRPALSFGAQTWTFRELQQQVDRVAHGLHRVGVRRDDVVALWMLNRPEWIFTFFAVTKLRAIVLPINTSFRADDCRYVLEHSESSTLILADRSGPVSYIDLLRTIAPDLDDQTPDGFQLSSLPGLRRVISLSHGDTPAGCLEWNDVVRDAGADSAAIEAGDPNETATIMYTSGTSGAPKGVVHTHHAIRNVVDQANRLNVRESDVILMFLPLFHAYGLYEGPLMSVLTGARCVLLERFEASKALTTLASERATLCFGFSTHFLDLMAHPDFEATDRSSLRAGIMAVGPLSTEEFAFRVQREFGGKIVSGYGMTETGVGTTLGFIDEDEAHSAATSGYPLPGYEFRVVDPRSGEGCAPGTAGEILVRSYQMMSGYLKDEERTASVLDADGWLHTGDVGVFQDDGYLRVLGRYKDMLRVAGENVDPAEVEALYTSRTEVASVVVVGVPDDRLEEVPCLCVELRDGYELDDALSQELLSLADGRLASFKRPRYVIGLSPLPMTASGKIAREEARVRAFASLGFGSEGQ